MGEWVLGIIGGSGLYDIDGLQNRRVVEIETPWGEPSDALTTGEIDGVRLVFLPRHGRGHRLTPTDINARANIDALKRAGCTDLVSLSAVGSLREEFRPRDLAIPDQAIDKTHKRANTFYEHAAVHVEFAEPFCPVLRRILLETAAGEADSLRICSARFGLVVCRMPTALPWLDATETYA